MFGNLPASSYPYSNLYGGTFSGSFEFDRLSPVSSNSSFSSFDMTSVSIDIIDNLGTTINTITNQSPENNTLRAATDGSYINLVFGYSAGLIHDTEDLRLSFDSTLLTGTGFGPTASEINASTFNTSPNTSFLETDGATAFTFWDLEVISASISATMVPVPSPSALWLIAIGLIGITGFKSVRT